MRRHGMIAILLLGLIAGGCARPTEDWLADVSSADEFTRLLAVVALGSAAEADTALVLPALLEATRDRKSKIARQAVESIARLGPTAQDMLIDILLDEDADATTSRSAATAIAGQAPDVIARLLEIAPRLGERENRALALALGETGPAAAPALAQGLDHADAKTRLFAASTLAILGADGSAAHDALVARLGDEDRDVRTFAARALARMGPLQPGARQALEGWLTQDRVQPVHKRTALLALVPHHVALLDSGSDDVRRESAAKLAAFGSAAVPAYIELLLRDDPVQKVRARRQLTALGAAAVPQLMAALSDPGFPERAAATTALIEMGPAIVPQMIRTLESGHRLARSAAATVLGGIGRESAPAIDALIRSLDDPNVGVSIAAILALSRMLPESGRAAAGVLELTERMSADHRPSIATAVERFAAYLDDGAD